jgi:uncharacterized protein (TIGR02001 family)
MKLAPRRLVDCRNSITVRIRRRNNRCQPNTDTKDIMKKFVLALLPIAVATGASADEAASSPHQLSGTVTATSDYIFRGLTQSWHRPALQASVDYTHTSGLYATLWTSTVSDKVIAGANAEIDVIAGWRGALGERWSYGGGVTSVFYPGANWNKMRWGGRADEKYDFTEANAFVGWKALTVKYSWSLNDLFGFNSRTGFSGSTKHSGYLEVNADIPLAGSGFVLGLHAGRQDFTATSNGIDPDFNDVRISLGKSFAGGWSAAVQVTGNSNKAFFDGTPSNLDLADTRNVGTRRWAVCVTRAF